MTTQKYVYSNTQYAYKRMKHTQIIKPFQLVLQYPGQIGSTT